MCRSRLLPLSSPSKKSLLKLRMLLLKQYHQSNSFLYCKILVSWRSCLMANISYMRPNRLVYRTGGFVHSLSLNHRLKEDLIVTYRLRKTVHFATLERLYSMSRSKTSSGTRATWTPSTHYRAKDLVIICLHSSTVLYKRFELIDKE